MTITTSNRPELFERTIKSMVANLADFHLISNIICVDDGSSDEAMTAMHKTEKAHLRGKHVKWILSKGGHPNALNEVRRSMMQAYATNFLHFEDDWEFQKPGKYITEALDVMQYMVLVKQVAFGRADVVPRFSHLTPFGVGYSFRKFWKEGDTHWPPFTLNPSVIRVEALEKTGEFHNVPNFEHEYGRRWQALGFETAVLNPPNMIHIGEGNSAYDINKTKR